MSNELIVDDPAFLAWYVGCVNDFPGGIVSLAIAARICSVSRQAMRCAVDAGKIRIRTWRQAPAVVHILPLDDVLTWHVARSREGRRYVGDWGRYIRNLIRTDEKQIVRVGDVLVCEACTKTTASADILQRRGAKPVKIVPRPDPS